MGSNNCEVLDYGGHLVFKNFFLLWKTSNLYKVHKMVT